MKDFEPKGAGDQTYLTPEQERARFVELFPVDIQTHLDAIGDYLRGIISKYKGSDWHGYEVPLFKYSQHKIEQQQWEEDDLQAAIDHVRRRVAARPYFVKASQEFFNLDERRKSVIRLDQEQAIVDDLEKGVPVLIRGHWRIGKSSMALRLVDRMGIDNSIFFDVGAYSGLDEEGLRKFKANFGLREVVCFIAEKDTQGQDIVKKRITSSSYHPFAFLNEWLEQNGETAFVGLDEIICFADNSKVMQFVAGLQQLKNIRVAIVLHHFARIEEGIRKLFAGYNTYYIRRITTDEARAMINHGLLGTEIKFTDDAVKELMEFSGGRPMEINYTVAALLDPFYNTYNPKLVYRAEDVKEITRRETWRLPDQYRDVAIYTYERAYRLAMSATERQIVDTLIGGMKLNIASIDPAVVKSLLDTNVLVEDSEAGEYRLNGSLFQRAMIEMKSKSSSVLDS